jgi:hypothetical protein
MAGASVEIQSINPFQSLDQLQRFIVKRGFALEGVQDNPLKKIT